MIKNVELKTSEVDPERQYFFVIDDNDQEYTVPLDPRNRLYIEVSEWYAAQKKPPFKFDFKNNKAE